MSRSASRSPVRPAAMPAGSPLARSYAAPRRNAGPLPWLLAFAVIGLQIAYPLLPAGHVRNLVTVATVATFFAASVLHAALTRGVPAALALVVIAGGGGFAAEVAGVRTGQIFGHYHYAATLGPRAFGVPILVALAWAMMAWPALLAARRLTPRRRWATPFVGAWALAAWDVFLDPQMVAAGHWTWRDVGRTLPGVDGVPLRNYVGWLVVSFAVMVVLGACVRRRSAPDGVPRLLYLWTFAASVVANATFFHRPGVAAAGGIAMGLVAVPLATSAWRDY